MSRKEVSPTKATTIIADKVLLDRISEHVKKNGGNQNDFVKKALLNQLEREGDDEIREMIERENGDEED